MPWYLLPHRNQKEVSSVMHWIQNGASLTIGPFSELSFETMSVVSVYIDTQEKETNNWNAQSHFS